MSTVEERIDDEDDGDDASLRRWVLAQLGDEPDAVAEDEDAMVPVKWVPGVGFVRRESA